MATYVPGTPSYMPEFKPFTPDYKFLSSVLDTKTNRYNTNYKQLNDLYSKVVYAPLSREDTQYMRDQYTQGLSDKLEKISGMDLSLAQNVDAAKAVFQPFFQEDIIVRDMVATKTYQNEKAYANRLLNSTDQERQDMYWDTGIQAMDYRMSDFINANPDDALNMVLPKYVPNSNLYKLTMDVLKESGISAEVDVVSGQFIYTQKNGNLVTEAALEYAQRSLQNNARVQQAYFTQSFVDGRNSAQVGLDEGRYASVEEGQRDWAINKINELKLAAGVDIVDTQANLTDAENTNASWEIFKNKYGILEGSQQEKQMQEQFSKYTALQQSLDRSNNIVSQGSAPINGQSTEDLLRRAYGMTMEKNMKGDMIAATKAYSMVDYGQTIKQENPSYKRQQEFLYAKALDDYKTANDLAVAKKKAELEGKGQASLLDGGYRVEFKSDPSSTERLTTTKDDDGNEVFNVIEYAQKAIVEMDTDVRDLKVNAILQTISKTQAGVSNNEYTIKLDDAGFITKPLGSQGTDDKETLTFMLNQKDPETGEFIYKKDIDRMYDEYNVQFNPPDPKENPPIENTQPAFSVSEEYPELDDYYSFVNDEVIRARDINTNFTNSLYKNQEKAKVSGLYGGQKDIDKFNDKFNTTGSDLQIVEQTKDGNRFIPKTEFIERYIEGAKAGKYQREQPNIFQSKDLGKYRRNVSSDKIPKNAIVVPDQAEGRLGVTIFDTEAAKEDAGKLYDNMYTMLNNTVSGVYSGEAEQIEDLRGDDQSVKGVRPDLTKEGTQVGFEVYDPKAAWMGRKQTGFVADLITSPTYTLQVDPLNINNDLTAANLLKDIMKQIQITPDASLTIQKGNLASQEDLDPTMINDEFAQTLINNYFRDIISFSRNPDQSKTANPGATISYSPGAGAYVINLDDAYLKSMQGLYTKGGENATITASQLNKYQNISIIFDKDQDISVRSSGEYNYSSVLSGINNSSSRQYSKAIANGGNITVNQDYNGDYIANVTFRHYDLNTKEYINLPTISKNLSNQIMAKTGTDDIMSHIDFEVYQLREEIQKKAKANNNLYETSNAANNATN